MKDVTMLFSDRKLTVFMQHADLFEDCKVILKPAVLASVVDDFGDRHVQAILKQAAEQPDYDLVAIYDRGTVYYRDQKVLAVSSGTEWCTLDDYMRL